MPTLNKIYYYCYYYSSSKTDLYENWVVLLNVKLIWKHLTSRYSCTCPPQFIIKFLGCIIPQMIYNLKKKRGGGDWLFTDLCPTQEFLTYMEMSPLPVKGCKRRPKFCSPSLAKVTSKYSWAGRKTVNNQSLNLCSALRAFEQGGIFIVPHLLWHGASVFPVSSEGPPHSWCWTSMWIWIWRG